MAEVCGHVTPGEGEEDVIDKCDRSGCSFDIQQNATRHHETNVRPKQTGSKRASTPLSVYTGVQPDGSWNRRIARI